MRDSAQASGWWWTTPGCGWCGPRGMGARSRSRRAAPCFTPSAPKRAGLWLVVDAPRRGLMRPEGYGDATTLAAGSTLFQARRTDAPRLRRGCTATGWSPGNSATFRASVAGEGRHMLGTVAESSEEV